jgi:sensor histidine kinase YesM
MAIIETNGKNLRILLHFGVWFILFFFPVFVFYGDTLDISIVARRTWAPMGFSVIIFYVNYFIFIEKFIFDRKGLRFIVSNILLVAVCIFLHSQIREIFFESHDKPHSSSFKIFSVYWESITAIITIGLSLAVRMTQRWIESENLRRNSENAQLHSELTYLQYQLQPHFFFNSLNNIYSLVDSAPEKAKETIHSLAKLMRYMLYEAKEGKVSLGKEVEFLEKFIDLMEIRLPANIKVKKTFGKVQEGTTITPLLFLPLVENAFKHGASGSAKGTIEFELSMADGEVTFTVANPNLPKTIDDKSGSGIGLVNLEKRLDLMYAGKYSIKHDIADNIYRTELKIKL